MARSEPLALVIPEFIPLAERTPEREAYVSEFQQVAADAGIKSDIAQGLLDHVVEVATTLQYDRPDPSGNAMLGLDDDVVARDQITRMFGAETGAQIIKAAQQTVRGLGPKVADYLNRTNLGNDVGVLVALAQTGYLYRTPETAREELAATMQSKAYARGDKLTVLKVAALSRIAHREEAEPTSAPAKPQMVRTGLMRTVPADVHQQEMRDELATLAKKSHHDLTLAERQRWMELIARVSQ
jgi:hypothetical protein